MSAGPGDIKSYDDEMIAVDGGRPLYAFYHFIRLSGGNFTVEGPDGTFPFEGNIAYTGTVRAYTPDTMWTYLPVNETENLLAAKEIKVANTDGSLVIGGKEYWCRGADNMDIVAALYCIVTVRNKLGEIVYSNVVEMPFQLSRTSPIEVGPELWGELARMETNELSPEQLKFWRAHVAGCWSNCAAEFEKMMASLKDRVTSDFQRFLGDSLDEMITGEKLVYESRIKELETEKSSKVVEKLRKELLIAENQKKQLTFNEEVNQENEERYNNLLQALSEAEWERDYQQKSALKKYLASEEKRMIEKVIPQRCTLATVDIQPAAVKILVRGDGA
jgi:hypothetical protein